MVGQNIVALCDVDWDYADEVFNTYPEAKRYKDFRIMLERQKDIEGVVIATPDHSHAIQAMAAMQLGKHVYCQKPLTHSVWESRQLTEAAKRYRVATQMGNEGHSGDDVRHEMDWVRACKEDPDSRKEASAHFGYSGPLNETVVMGNLSIRLQGLNREFDWDGEKMEITNIGPNETLNLITKHEYSKINKQPQFNTEYKEVNALEFAREMIRHTYREGWG